MCSHRDRNRQMTRRRHSGHLCGTKHMGCGAKTGVLAKIGACVCACVCACSRHTQICGKIRPRLQHLSTGLKTLQRLGRGYNHLSVESGRLVSPTQTVGHHAAPGVWPPKNRCWSSRTRCLSTTYSRTPPQFVLCALSTLVLRCNFFFSRSPRSSF